MPFPINRSLLHSPAAAQVPEHSLAEAKIASQWGPQSQPCSATQLLPSKIQPRDVAQSPKSVAPRSSQASPPPVVPVGSPVEVEAVPDVDVADVEDSESVVSELVLPVALSLLPEVEVELVEPVEPEELEDAEEELVALSDVLPLSSLVQARVSPKRSAADTWKYE